MRIRQWIIVVVVAACGGCQWNSPSVAPPATLPVAKAPEVTTKPSDSYLANSGANKDGEVSNQTAVEKALDWAAKYQQSMQTVAELQKESREQLKQMQAQEQDKIKLQAELTAAQKELKDANALLIEMRQEVTKWKTDVLGFRGEMKEAQQAQIDMLGRVLKLLGSDVPTKPAASKPDKEPTSEPATK
jgi:hypothetical protein